MTDFDRLKRIAKRNWDAQSSYRDKMRDDFAFKDGHQHTDDELTALDETQRAALVFNRVAPILASVSGSEINNRTEVRFIPREIGDAKPNEILTAGAEWFRDEANSEDEDSQAFEDMLTCGIGFTETYLDFEADSEGRPSEQRIDPLEMFWDCHAHRKGLSDSAVFGRVRSIPCDEARGMWPDRELSDINAGWITPERVNGNVSHNIVGDEYRDGDGYDEQGNGHTVTVVQMQWRERERVVEYADPQTGGVKTMPKAQWDKVAALSEFMPQHRVVTKHVWKQAFLGNVMLGESQPCEVASTFRAITGHWDRKDERFYGLLRSMRDPQRFANKMLSQTMHIIGVNAKGGVLIEKDAVDDMRTFEESWAASDSVSIVKAGRLGSVTPKPGPQMPAALMQLGEFAISSIRDVSGVNMELMGMREAAQAGVLEYQRRQASMTTLAFYFDSLRFYRKQQGDVILWFLQKWIAPTGRLVRIVRKGLQEYVPLAMEDDTRRYDVIVDDSPQAPNEKERAWQVIQAMLPLLQQAGLSLEDWADVMDYSPLPASFADKLRAKAQEQAQQPQQPDPAQMAQLQNLQAQTNQRNADAQYKQAQAAKLGQPDPSNLGQFEHPVEIAARAAKDESAAQLNQAKTYSELQRVTREDEKVIMDWLRAQQPRQ